MLINVDFVHCYVATYYASPHLLYYIAFIWSPLIVINSSLIR